jgi:hypothetical protein
LARLPTSVGKVPVKKFRCKIQNSIGYKGRVN